MILDTFRVDGQVAMVTGGTRGLGKAIAIGLAEAGAALFLASPASNYVHGVTLLVDGGGLNW